MKVLNSGTDMPGGEPTPLLQGRETILVVEDESMMRGLIVTALQHHGYTVLSAKDGEDAIAVATQYAAPVHLVIADVVMPRLDGCALVTAMRRWFPTVGVLLMSGFAEGAVRALSMDDDRTFFIHKPFSVPAFVAAVRSAVEWRPTTRPAG